MNVFENKGFFFLFFENKGVFFFSFYEKEKRKQERK